MTKKIMYFALVLACFAILLPPLFGGTQPTGEIKKLKANIPEKGKAAYDDFVKLTQDESKTLKGNQLNAFLAGLQQMVDVIKGSETGSWDWGNITAGFNASIKVVPVKNQLKFRNTFKAVINSILAKDKAADVSKNLK
jgi:hypothetical protein